MPARVIVVGARRRRQGIGPYVARALARAGADVCAVVGSTNDTSLEAAVDLKKFDVLRASAYADLGDALRSERADLVAVCAPNDTHRTFLLTAAQHGAGCLCDKPLWWDTDSMRAGDVESQTASIVDAFVDRGLLLDTLTQWAEAWPIYDALYPHATGEPVRSFRMILSPIEFGPSMVPDALPHALSLLWARVGAGVVDRATAVFDEPQRRLRVGFDYQHQHGSTSAQCVFTACESQPRPAAFGVNGRMAHRAIEMSDYSMRLVADNGRGASLPDPLDSFIRNFLRRLERRPTTDRPRLLSSMTNLWRVYDAALQAFGAQATQR